ncbi:hypothetical protein TOPH_06027 [Tolypocladium ophioglossoides CBS 100239]|uniref:Uncharacterized protein n=1 Tax=Tolypocladium ophioglossoides (strain CBS 100239) TaxID=1163406 RepID=A0A0L0N5K6_TOLOC|nr:hypothetical protein TOPH_06027 [Tolypocladium ophioglossoides CBS 100239]
MGSLTRRCSWEATNIAMSFITALCTLFEVAKFVAEALTPWTMLFTHVIKLTCASAILALDVVIYVQRKDANYSLVGLGLDGLLIITSIALTIYAVLTYRRLSAYDDYVRPVNVKGYGFNDGLDRDFSYSSRLSIRNSIDKRGSVGSSRLSFASAGNDAVHLQTMERAPGPYSHQRDTQFDDYVARRSSWNHKADLERSVSAEFERARSREASPDGVVVAAGVVKTRSRGPSVGRATSYTSDHVLVAVPEEAEGLEGPAIGPYETDREALLGRSRRNSDDGPAVLQEVDVAEPRWQRG